MDNFRGKIGSKIRAGERSELANDVMVLKDCIILWKINGHLVRIK
jgi:hypothetical protein